MAIDIKREKTLTLTEASDYLASLGRPTTVKTLRRWCARGWLEHGRWGDVIITSEEALQRHSERDDRRPERCVVDVRAAEEAGRRLEASGW